MSDAPVSSDPRRALRALAIVAGLATLALLTTLMVGSPDLIARLPAWTMYASAGALIVALIGLELTAPGAQRRVLAALAKLGFAPLVVCALFLLAYLTTHH